MAAAVVKADTEECAVKNSKDDNCSKCKCDYSCIGNIFFRKRNKRKVKIKKQAYPYGLSKYVVMCLGCLSICLTSSLYYNWTIFEDLFMRQGALAGLCTEEERKAAKPNTFICDAQRRQISNLYSAIMYTDSFVGSIGGYIGDRFGAYCALLIGQVFGIIAFVMFYLFTQSTVMLYVTFMFWGVSASFALAPTWHYSRMFTFGNNMAVSVITSADNMSMYTPTFFQMIANRYNIGFTGASLTYVFWGVLVCIAVTLFFIPKRFIVMDEEEEESEEDYQLTNMFNQGMMKAVKNARYWLSVTCYVLLCSVRLFYRRSFTLLFFDNEEVTEFLEVSSDFSFAGSFVLGYMNEFFGVVPMMGVTTLMYIAALIAVYFRNFPCAYTSALLFAIAQAGDIQQLITFIDEYFPEHESTLMGLANIVNTIFGLLLQYTFNHVFDWLGPRITVFIMILILGGVLVICYIIELGMKSDDEEEEEEEEEKENSKEPTAEDDEMDYNPLGPKILLYNIFGAFLSFPYFASLCTAVAINNMNQEDETDLGELKDRTVRTLEKEQFFMSMHRIVELCSAVFYTSLIVLLGCIFEFSRRTELMQTHNCILLLMSILIGCAGGTSLLLPYTQIFSVMPPIVTVALTVVPPLSLVIFGWIDRRDAFSFTIMCTLVGVYGFVLFMAGNIMLYMNSLMGARFGKPAHSLMGWSNLGMGYFYTLLIIYTIRELYTGDCNIGGYIIVMGMQCAISVFATLVLYLHLSHEKQYFYVKCEKEGSSEGSQCTEESQKCTHEDDPATHVDYFIKDDDKGGCNNRVLKFRSQHSTKFDEIRNTDYSLWNVAYSTAGVLKPDPFLLLLAVSVVISLSDASIAFLVPGLFVQMTLMTVSAYFTVRLLFGFLDDKIEEAVNGRNDYVIGSIWGTLLSICIALFLLNVYQLKWLVAEEIPKRTYIIFCLSYCVRMWMNAFAQHHIISRLEQFKILKWEKKERAHNTVMYMNLGHSGGLGVLTYLCYRYFT